VSAVAVRSRSSIAARSRRDEPMAGSMNTVPSRMPSCHAALMASTEASTNSRR
jgi:hypothetical protein